MVGFNKDIESPPLGTASKPHLKTPKHYGDISITTHTSRLFITYSFHTKRVATLQTFGMHAHNTSCVTISRLSHDIITTHSDQEHKPTYPTTLSVHPKPELLETKSHNCIIHLATISAFHMRPRASAAGLGPNHRTSGPSSK